MDRFEGSASPRPRATLTNDASESLPDPVAQPRRASDGPAVARQGDRRCPSPRAIYDHLDRFVIGQHRAKRAVATAAYDHLRRVAAQGGDARLLRKSNILLVGPTGTGKTHIARHLATVLDVGFTVVDATEFTEAGYYGRDVEQIVSDLLSACDHDVDRCQRGIVFIDELDKIARRAHGGQTSAGQRDIGGEGVQQALLKLLEGRQVLVPVAASGGGFGHRDVVTIDTSQILFICAGTFSDLGQGAQLRRPLGFNGGDGQPTERVTHRHLAEYGLLEELLGRLPVVVQLEPLGEDELLQVLTGPPDCIMAEYRARFALDGVTLRVEDTGLRAIVRQAQRAGLGARGLRAVVEEVMAEALFEAPESEGRQLTVDGRYVDRYLDARR